MFRYFIFQTMNSDAHQQIAKTLENLSVCQKLSSCELKILVRTLLKKRTKERRNILKTYIFNVNLFI